MRSSCELALGAQTMNIKNVMSLTEIATDYEIPLCKLYDCEKDYSFNFPKRIKVANRNRLPIYEKYEIEKWYHNIYLKHEKVQAKYGNGDIINQLLSELLV